MPQHLGFAVYGEAALAAATRTEDLFGQLNGLSLPSRMMFETHWRDPDWCLIADDSQNWDRDIAFLRSITKLEIWVKGSMLLPPSLKFWNFSEAKSSCTGPPSSFRY